MYVLQAILLFLKLYPNWSPLFSYGSSWTLDHTRFTVTYIHSHLDMISWWIILIPSYFILAKAVKDHIFPKAVMRVGLKNENN